MKFTDGFWLTRPEFQAFFPAQAYDAEADKEKLTVHIPTRRINHRGDTLGGPVVMMELTAPMPDVLKVRISHYTGPKIRGPFFATSADKNSKPSISADLKGSSITSGRLSAKVPGRDDPWKIEFQAEGKTITSSPNKGVGYLIENNGRTWVKDELSLDVGELVYGLGERFSAFTKNGQAVEIWNKDGGTASEQGYKNVPFYLTNRGYGVFVNHPEQVNFEVASEKVSRVQFAVQGEYLEYFLIYGPTPKEVLERYTALTGRAPLPPLWSFGLWMTTSFTTNYDEETVTGFIKGMEERKLPLSVFHFDCFWMKEFTWSSFLWDPRVFPDPKGMLQRLKARGLKICVWINSYIAQRSALFAEGVEKGYFIKKPNGDVWQTDGWQPGMAIVDFTNPAAAAWFASKLEALLDMGVDAFKTDFGERIPTDVTYFDGSDPQKMHNYYPQLYNKTVFDLLKKKRGEGEAVVFARSACAGGQIFPVHWGGDCDSTFPSMAESLRGGLSLGLSGFGFWSHDIGGFEGTPPVELFKRWIAFGLLSSHSRLHGSSSYRVPWVYGEEACDVLRVFTNLKMRLMPYLFGAAVEATKTGTPVMRAMLLEFPGDLVAQTLDRQYMLGPELLVAPVFNKEGRGEFYVPAGTWTDIVGGETFQGPAWHTKIYEDTRMPILARPGSLVPFGAETGRPDYDWTKDLTVRAFQIADGSEAVLDIVGQNGKRAATIRVTRRGTGYDVKSEGIDNFKLEVEGKSFVVKGGKASLQA